MTAFDANPHAVTVMHEYGCDLRPNCTCGTPRPPLCDHAPLLREQQQRITALEAEKRALLEQLHRQEDLLALYRQADLDADEARIDPHAPQWAPEPEDQS